MKTTRLAHVLLAIALAACLTACGNKGPLVHPDKEKPAEATSAQEPAATSN